MLTLNTLGSVRVLRDGVEITNWTSRKVVALLIYLAFNRQPQARDLLATLLWNDQSTRRGLANLSVLLSHLRKRIGRSYLITNRQTISLNWEQPITIPAYDFLTYLENLPENSLTDEQYAALKQTLTRYTGDFLADFSIRNAAGFEEWSLVLRERIQRQMVRALDRAAYEAERRGLFLEGIRYARHNVALDPLREKGQRALMRLLALDGQRNAALTQFAECQQLLLDELGVEPDEKTSALFAQIKANELVQAARSHNLPHAPTSFIGRLPELLTITTQLRDDACRLLTLTGLGGAGKTRLALAAAQQLTNDFADGVWWVSLAGLESADYLTGLLNDTFNISTQADPQHALFDHLRDKSLLLVLDNFEHLLDCGVDLLVALLHETTNVRLLITSRERLNLQAEWLLSVTGLPFPERNRPVVLTDYPAPQLFIQRAKQVKPDFVPITTPIVDICQMVDGLPLAVELAASWVRVDDVETIADLLATDVQLLETTLRDVPTRQRSIQAAFDYSWRLLDSAEQATLTQLTYFRNHFTAAAARTIFDITKLQLRTLIDKSLLTMSEKERYQLHPLVRQLAAKRRANSPAQERAFATYFLEWTTQQAAAINHAASRTAISAIQQQLDNIRAAWRFALQHSQFDLLEQSLSGLAAFYHFQGRFQDGIIWLRETVRQLEGASAETVLSILGAAYSHLAGFQQGVGDFEAGLQSARQGAIYAEQIGDTETVIDILLRQGLTLYRHGKLAQSQRVVEEAHRLAEIADLQAQQITTLNSLGILTVAQNNVTAAIRYTEKSLAICRDVGNLRGQGIALNNLGSFALTLNDFEQAFTYFEEALAIKQQIGEQQSEAHAWVNLAVVWFLQSDFAKATDCLAAATEIANEIGDQRLYALLHSNRALFAIRSGDVATGLAEATHAGELADAIGDFALKFHALHHQGHAHAEIYSWQRASIAYRAAIVAAEASKQPSLVSAGQAALAWTLLKLEEIEEARDVAAKSVAYLNSHKMLQGVVEPQRTRQMLTETVAKLRSYE